MQLGRPLHEAFYPSCVRVGRLVVWVQGIPIVLVVWCVAGWTVGTYHTAEGCGGDEFRRSAAVVVGATERREPSELCRTAR